MSLDQTSNPTPNLALGDIRIPGLFRDLPEAVIVTNENRRISWVNPAFEDMFGYRCEDLINQTTKALYEDPTHYEEQLKRRFISAKTSHDHSYEMRYRRKNGKSFLTQTTGGPIRDKNDAVLGYFAIIKDISKTRALEDLLHSLFHISSHQEIDTTTKINKILQLGSDHFQTDSALVSWVQGERYTVLYSHSDIVDIPRGTTFKLGDTYCSEMLKSNGPLACHNARQSKFSTHPCYDLFLLETYIGVPLIVDGEQFGTLNFTSPETRHPFDNSDKEVIKMFAAWIGQQLSFEKATNQLPAKSDFE